MLKVVIADDEERICRLICALVDWDSLGMEIAGTAHNGLEALEVIKETHPQILITDIRMPGCSGLELIQKVKKIMPELEIIIVSGYAHFEYAKNAIRYGVGDYLLKPVDKTELNATLEKLKKKVVELQEDKEQTQQLLKKNRKDTDRLRQSLIEHLMEEKQEPLSYEILRDEYGLLVNPGLFQVFLLKVDDYLPEVGESGLSTVLDKAQHLLDSSVRSKCQELLLGRYQDYCLGLLNYVPARAEEIRRILKDCLNQLEARSEIYGSIHFTLALGAAVKEPERILSSMKDASVIVQERLIKGAGRALERMPSGTRPKENNFPEKYLREIKGALELLSVEESRSVTERLSAQCCGQREMRGQEILDLVCSCGSLFLSQLGIPDRGQVLDEFCLRCRQCSGVDRLFAQLDTLQVRYIEEQKQIRENDTERPIRMAKQYIQKHFSEQITLEEVSSAVGLSTAYFSVQFKKAEGEGFAKYLIRVRMEQAKILLRETNDSVSEICRRVGYNDLKHFNQSFEKVAGVKPSLYRKLYG